MNRRTVTRLFCQGGGTFFLAGCAGLDLSAGGEGTGIQLVTALTILAKYRASQAQRAAAEQAARRAFVALAMKPAMQKASSNVRRQVAVAQAPAPAAGGAIQAGEAKPLDEAAFASAWKSTAEAYEKSGDAGAAQVAMPKSNAEIVFPSMSSQEMLMASSALAPNYIAVSVPAQGIAPESGAGEVVMLWNARTRKLEGEYAYAVKERPKNGRKVTIDGIPAVYVGQPGDAKL